jgi:hypothetical protein
MVGAGTFIVGGGPAGAGTFIVGGGPAGVGNGMDGGYGAGAHASAQQHSVGIPQQAWGQRCRA